MENRNMLTNPAPCVLEGYANMLVDGYDGTIQQHRVVDGHTLFKEGYKLYQLYPVLQHAEGDYRLVIGYSIANELEISKRSVQPHEIPYVLLTEQGLLRSCVMPLRKSTPPLRIRGSSMTISQAINMSSTVRFWRGSSR